jgi:hypothetical protein
MAHLYRRYFDHWTTLIVILATTLLICGCGLLGKKDQYERSQADRVTDIVMAGETSLIIGLNLNTDINGNRESTGFLPEDSITTPLSILESHLSTEQNSLTLIDFPINQNRPLYQSLNGRFMPINSISKSSTTPVSSKTTSFNFVVRDSLITIGDSVKEISATRVGIYNGFEKCLIFVETGFKNNLSEQSWEQLHSFCNDSVIELTNQFAPQCNLENQSLNAECDLDENQRFIVLFYNLGNKSYAGYVDPYDFDPDKPIQYYGRSEILYLNATHLEDNTNSLFKIKLTIAHEFQHVLSKLITYSLGVHPLLDTWIEEGLAESASHHMMIKNQLSTSEIDTPKYIPFRINEFDSIKVKEGIGFIKWSSNTANYALSYLFFQYLRGQSKEPDTFFRRIHQQANINTQTVFNIVNNNQFEDFNDLLLSFHLASIYNSPDLPKYQFSKDNTSYFNGDIVASKAQILSSKSQPNPSIEPGGRIIKLLPSAQHETFVPQNQGENIWFIRVN